MRPCATASPFLEAVVTWLRSSPSSQGNQLIKCALRIYFDLDNGTGGRRRPPLLSINPYTGR